MFANQGSCVDEDVCAGLFSFFLSGLQLQQESPTKSTSAFKLRYIFHHFEWEPIKHMITLTLINQANKQLFLFYYFSVVFLNSVLKKFFSFLLFFAPKACRPKHAKPHLKQLWRQGSKSGKHAAHVSTNTHMCFFMCWCNRK